MEKEQISKSAEKGLVIKFPMGILGFEEIQEYILRQNGHGPVWELSSAAGGYPRFVLFAAESVADSYCPKLAGEVLDSLQTKSRKELSFFVIAVVPENIARTTVNLRSPIVVNFRAGLAAQVVLENAGYPMRHPIFPAEGRAE